jgi:hypothetical protein
MHRYIRQFVDIFSVASIYNYIFFTINQGILRQMNYGTLKINGGIWASKPRAKTYPGIYVRDECNRAIT